MPTRTESREADPRRAELQEILKSLKPKSFTVKDPIQFRKALAEILEDLSRM
jgi:hypothetical protein